MLSIQAKAKLNTETLERRDCIEQQITYYQHLEAGERNIAINF